MADDLMATATATAAGEKGREGRGENKGVSRKEESRAVECCGGGGREIRVVQG